MFRLSIIGNLGAAPTIRTAANGREFMSFSVAISHRDKSTTWVNVTGNKQEKLMDYLTKGRQVYVTGDGAIEMYKGQPDVTIYADRIELCGKSNDQQEQAETSKEENTF